MEAWKASNLMGMRNFLSTNNSNASLGVPYGKAFESYAHSVLAGGGTFPMRVLHTNKQELPIVRRNFLARTTLPARQVKEIPNNLIFPTLEPGDLQKYLQLTSPTFGAVDSLILSVPQTFSGPASYLLQITSDASHGMNAPELNLLLTNARPYLRARGIKHIYLVYVVPHFMYRTFTVQVYNGDITAANLNAIEQWVLSIDTSISANYAGLRVEQAQAQAQPEAQAQL